jgi:hypothetical protein
LVAAELGKNYMLGSKFHAQQVWPGIQRKCSADYLDIAYVVTKSRVIVGLPSAKTALACHSW